MTAEYGSHLRPDGPLEWLALWLQAAGMGPERIEEVIRLAFAAVAEEREACVKDCEAVAEETRHGYMKAMQLDFMDPSNFREAAAMQVEKAVARIRARGQADTQVPVGTVVTMGGDVIIPGVPDPTEEQKRAVLESVAKRLGPDQPPLPVKNYVSEYKPPE